MKITSFVPNLITDDMSGTLTFYLGHLGFELGMSVPESPPFGWAQIKHGPVELMFQTREGFTEDLNIHKAEETGGTLLFHAHVTGIREWYEYLKDVARMAFPIRQTFYGMDEFGFYDPSGYLIVFAEPTQNPA